MIFGESDLTEGGAVYVALKSYIDKIEAEERSRPVSLRRRVPHMKELAESIGVNPVTLSNIANNKIKQLNLELAGRIITALRQHGFETDVSDILTYRPPETASPKAEMKP
jgi:DNA-binding Xre family transcriptional regulator